MCDLWDVGILDGVQYMRVLHDPRSDRDWTANCSAHVSLLLRPAKLHRDIIIIVMSLMKCHILDTKRVVLLSMLLLVRFVNTFLQ